MVTLRAFEVLSRISKSIWMECADMPTDHYNAKKVT